METYLNINIDKFGKEDFNFSLNILQSGVYTINTTFENLELLFDALSGLNFKFFGDIKLNGISIKKNRKASFYLQKNTLFIKEINLMQNLTLKENIKMFSKIWSGEDLSNFTIDYFKINKIKDALIRNLEKDDLCLVNLTKLLSCPASIWLINKKLIDILNYENRIKIEAIIDSRIKQNGIIILIGWI